MLINKDMSLDQLAERMGSEATCEDAAVMCEFLLVGDYETTEDMPESVWLDCLNMVAEAKRADEARS